MTPLRVAYAGFDLLDVCLDELLRQGVEIVEIFTCKVDEDTEHSTHVRDVARLLQVPLSDEPIRAADLRRLEQKGCDVLLSAAYYHWIPVPCDCTLRMVNVHPSLLPEGRGAWPMPVMILRGMYRGGVTIHRTVREMDAGPILLQRPFEAEEGTNLEEMTQLICSILPEMIGTLVRDFNSLYENAQPQSEGSYWPCPTQADWTVTPDMSLEEADRILRAFYGFDCLYLDGGRRVMLMHGRALPGDGPMPVIGGHIEGQIRSTVEGAISS